MCVCIVVFMLFSCLVRTSEMPTEAHNTAMKELKRLKKMPQQMPEHAMIRYTQVS